MTAAPSRSSRRSRSGTSLVRKDQVERAVEEAVDCRLVDCETAALEGARRHSLMIEPAWVHPPQVDSAAHHRG